MFLYFENFMFFFVFLNYLKIRVSHNASDRTNTKREKKKKNYFWYFWK